MATKIRIELNKAAIGALLKSSAVFGLVESKIGAAMAAVGGEEAGFKSSVYVGRDRVRGQIWTATNEARQAEAEHRTLTRALGRMR